MQVLAQNVIIIGYAECHVKNSENHAMPTLLLERKISPQKRADAVRITKGVWEQ